MGWVVLILVVAILFGMLGLVVKVLKWMLIVAAVLFLIGVVAGFRKRR